ncbi:MAG: hypothetical protein NC830_04195 [Candidatus Omnitrophica bacterium]|nr:hypothetical protein [Candidatus Omnitrophota bacterium]
MKNLFGIKIATISIFLFLCFLKFIDVTARDSIQKGNFIDGSWKYAIARLPQINKFFGKDIFFTYGPLAHVFPWTIIPENLQTQLGLQIRYMVCVGFLYLFYFWLFINLYRKHFIYAFVLLTALLLNPLSEGINDSIIYGIIGLTCVMFLKKYYQAKEKNTKVSPVFFLLGASAFFACTFLYKISYGFSTVFTLLLLMTYGALKKSFRLLKYSVFSAILFISLSFLFYAFSTGGHLCNFLLFLKHTYGQAMNYSEMLSLPPLKREPVFLAAALSFSLITMAIFYPPARPPLLILLPSLFTAFKAGFVRADGHMLIFFNSVPLLLSGIPLYLENMDTHKSMTGNVKIIGPRSKTRLKIKLQEGIVLPTIICLVFILIFANDTAFAIYVKISVYDTALIKVWQ